MNYKLEKPYTDIERADFICGYQGLNYYEDDNCIIMYSDDFKIVDGDAVLDPDYEAQQSQKTYNEAIQREINSYYEYLYRDDGSGSGAGAAIRLVGANALGYTTLATNLTTAINTRHQTLITNCNAIEKE